MVITIKEPHRILKYAGGLSSWDLEEVLRNDVEAKLESIHSTEHALRDWWDRRRLQRQFEKFTKLRVEHQSGQGGTFLDLLAHEITLLNTGNDNDIELEDIEYAYECYGKRIKYHGIKMKMNVGGISYNFKIVLDKQFKYKYPDVYRRFEVGRLTTGYTKKGVDMFNALNLSDWPLVERNDRVTQNSNFVFDVIKRFAFLNEQLKIGKHMEDNLEALTEKAAAIVKAEFDEFASDNLVINSERSDVRYDTSQFASSPLNKLDPREEVTFVYTGTPEYHRQVGNVSMTFFFKTNISIRYTSDGFKITQRVDNDYGISPLLLIEFTGDDERTQVVKKEILEMLKYYDKFSSLTHVYTDVLDQGGRIRCLGEKDSPITERYARVKRAAIQIDRYLSDFESSSLPYELQPTDEEVEQAVDSLS